MGLGTYVVRRLLYMVPVLFGVSVLVFLLIHLIPGNPVATILGPSATEQQYALLTKELDLNQPLYVQYFDFMSKLLRGNLGTSYYYGVPVVTLIERSFPATLELTIAATAIMIVVAIPVGVLAAIKKDSVADHASMVLSVAGFSIPSFWLGILAIILFAGILHWLPSFGRLSPGITVRPITGMVTVDSLLEGNMSAFFNAVKHLILPACTLAAAGTAVTARLTRAKMLEVLGQDYIRAVIAKGASSRVVYFNHALRNALISIFAFVTLQFGYLLGGVVIIEAVFSWPGIGSLLIATVEARDYQTVQAVVLIFALIWLVVNFLTDIAYTVIDPRIRYT